MTAISDLIERVKGLSGPSLEVDAEIAATLQFYHGTAPDDIAWVHGWLGEWQARGTAVHLVDDEGRSPGCFYPARLTASLDAALALAERVLPGWNWVLRSSPPFEALVMCPEVRPGRREFGTAIAATAPLALLLAILEAKGEMS